MQLVLLLFQDKVHPPPDRLRAPGGPLLQNPADAQHLGASGNENVILCERGIRTFETFTRNTLDLQSIPVLNNKTHLPVVIDPSHAGGKWWLVEPMAKAAVAAGADGLMIEVHNNPECALCDGAQSLKPEKFDALLKQIRQIAEVVGKQI